MDCQQLAATLTEALGLERPPVALAFVAERPAQVPDPEGPVPAACTFWRLGQQRLLYADGPAHYECPIGTLTMGFELPTSERPKAEQLVGTMVELGYFDAAETAHLPAVQRPHQGIVYGPLADFPLPPDVVLIQTTPFQAMLLSEASGGAELREVPGFAAMGRPACAAVARTANEGAVTMSLGCIGARTYAELSDDRALVILPAAALERTAQRLPSLVRANQTLAGYHGERKARF